MKRSLLFSAAPCLLALLLLSASLSPAIAQKKKKDPVPPAGASAPQVPGKSSGSMRDVLRKIQGQMTNLGTLTRVTGDYVVFENDGDTLMYPLNVLQVVKFLKADEGEPRKIEIKFLARD
jgi:hypothetical protein